ncbi:sensor histidine kinase [Pseudonocardia sp. WMMC193]|uniref:sensor histidine kinase n=1 Tax=Pseudonocardia sp. WMMC193 TaxID=2911965 RepID=UPI001EFFCC6C|nr:histidine kinase [Pseudonocardia sp. WMMC193]MCF7553235.1 histidine kinase [Pseudonocardia sp. WMMC193]
MFPDRRAAGMLIGLTALFVALDVLAALLGGRTTGALGPWAGLALQLAADLALLVVLRAPYAVLAFLTAGSVAAVVAPETFVPTVVVNGGAMLLAPTTAAIFVLVQVRDRRATWILVAALTLFAVRVWDPGWDSVPLGLLATAVPALAGRYVAARRRIMADLVERAERTDREQHLLAEQARAEERARLAAEMHDVVSHRITLMVLQAGAMEVTGDERARTLRETGMQALDELRGLVRVLSVPEGPSPRVGPDAPAPDLCALVEASAAAGMTVHLEGELPAGPRGRTLHRVVQEALTNAHKHARGADVWITVDDRGVAVVNGAADPDPELAGSGSGVGLRGLRERVEVAGGTFHAGPTADGGFEVRAAW